MSGLPPESDISSLSLSADGSVIAIGNQVSMEMTLLVIVVVVAAVMMIVVSIRLPPPQHPHPQ